MGEKAASGIMLVLLTIGMLSLTFNIQPAKARTITVPDDYPTIQEAINSANDGDTILVRAGTYYEKVVVNKTVSLVGENRDTTVVDGNMTYCVFNVTAPNVVISNFTIRGSGVWHPIFEWLLVGEGGICLFNVSGCHIYNNNLTEPGNGAVLRFSWNNTVSGNIGGIELHEAWNNTIANNSLSTVYLENSNHNVIYNNTISTLTLSISHGNEIANNTLSDGILLSGERYSVEYGCSSNVIQNNLINGASGISIEDHSNNTIVRGNRLTQGNITIRWNFWPPILGNNTICNNTLLNGGILISGSQNNMVSSNICSNYTIGIEIRSEYNTLINNALNNGTFGIMLASGHNILKGNGIANNQYGFGVMPLYFESVFNEIDTSNTLDGKPIYHFVNQSDLFIEPSTYPNIGYLGFVNCYNVTARNLVLHGNGQGVFIAGGSEISIANCTIEDNIVGIDIIDSTACILNNSISRNAYGIYLRAIHEGACLNTIINNTIENNTFENLPSDLWFLEGYSEMLDNRFSGGILVLSSNNTIINNRITNNRHGIYLAWGNNTLRSNYIADNQYNFGIEGYSFSHYINDINASNLVNGKPIYYWINQHNKHVPEDAGYVALINSTEISVENLNLANNVQGVLIVGCNNTSIKNNTITNVRYGITITWIAEGYPPTAEYPSFNHTIDNNKITDSDIGIHIHYSSQNMISRNTLLRNTVGINIQADFNSINYNTIANSTCHDPLWASVPKTWQESGIRIEGAFNILYGNIISNNSNGLLIGIYTFKGYNFIIHNNFLNNTVQTICATSNFWDDGYPSGGNFWSDYTGEDLFSGPYQNETGSDGIGDTAYVIGENNVDRYPLMGPFNSFNTSIGYFVEVISNSTVEDFRYFESNSTIVMYVSNMTANQTAGFCRLIIPHDIMPPPYTVKVNDTIINFQTIYENYTEGISIIYFTYEHSKLEITIIPEYPSMTIMLLLSATLVTTTLTKRKLQRRKCIKEPQT